MSAFLVVLRAGDDSLHPNWLGGARNWDLAISYYGMNPQKAFPEASLMHRFRGGKWNGIHDFLKCHPEVIEKYDYFWLPDDDLLTDANSINAIFELMEKYDLELAQPALTKSSYFSHLLTVQNPCFSIRYTTMVELMAPVMTRSFLSKVSPYFEYTQSGFGLDMIWHRLTSDPASRVAIFDQVAMYHTRPVGGALAVQLGHQTISREREKEIFLTQWNVGRHHAVAFRGNLANGTVVRSQALCVLIQILCWLGQCWRFKWSGHGQLVSMRKFYWFARACASLFRKPDVASLTPPKAVTGKEAGT